MIASLFKTCRKERRVLKHCPFLGGWHQGSEGPSRGVAPEVGSLIYHHLQQQVSVAGQHVLRLLVGQLLTCQLCPPDGPLLGSRDHCRCCCRGPGAPIPCHRGGQRPGGRLYASHQSRFKAIKFSTTRLDLKLSSCHLQEQI